MTDGTLLTGSVPNPASSTSELPHPLQPDAAIFNRIADAIASAPDAHVLLFIDRVKIPNTKGLSDQEREKLHQGVRKRFKSMQMSFNDYRSAISAAQTISEVNSIREKFMAEPMMIVEEKRLLEKDACRREDQIAFKYTGPTGGKGRH